MPETLLTVVVLICYSAVVKHRFIFCSCSVFVFRERRSSSWDSSKGKGNHKTSGGQKSGNDEKFNMSTIEWGQIKFLIMIIVVILKQKTVFILSGGFLGK